MSKTIDLALIVDPNFSVFSAPAVPANNINANDDSTRPPPQVISKPSFFGSLFKESSLIKTIWENKVLTTLGIALGYEYKKMTADPYECIPAAVTVGTLSLALMLTHLISHKISNGPSVKAFFIGLALGTQSYSFLENTPFVYDISDYFRCRW